MSITPSPVRRSMLRILLTVAVVATVLPLNASPASAAGNQAVSLDGTNDHVDLGAGSTSLGANQFTLELWFKRTGAGVATGTSSAAPGLTSVIPLITKGRTQSGEGDGSPADVAYFLGIDTATGRLAADFEDGQFAPVPGTNHGLIGVLPSTTTAIPMNVWQHAAVTYDGVSMRLYLNGQLDILGPAINQQPQSNSAHRVGIGTSFNAVAPITAAGFFAGQMDEVRIWNVARTETQIQSSMSTELTSGTGLTGRWGMNEGSGTAVGGSVGGINGTLANGGTWAAGASMLDPVTAPTAGGNNGLLLDGADDAINLGVGAVGSPLGAAQFTLELWFKQMGGGQIASTGSGGVTTAVPLITKGRSESDVGPIDTNYFLGINAATRTLAADFEDTAAGGNHPVNGTTVITQNVWHHAAATFNGSQFCLYLDGVLDGTCTATTTIPRSDSSQIPAVGTAYNSTGTAVGRFAGRVDEARIWSVARTQAQIQAAMNTPITTPTTGLLGRWAMNEGTGTTAANTAGSAGINGTLQNGTTWTSGAPIDAPAGGNFGVGLDGSNDHVDLGAGSTSLGANQFTLELWFKRTGAGVISQTSGSAPGLTSVIPLITKGKSEADGDARDVAYFLGINTAPTGGGLTQNAIAADFEDVPGGLNHGFSGVTPVPMNVWTHAAVTYDGSVMRLYLNGQLDATSPVIGVNPQANSTHKVGIGTSFQSPVFSPPNQAVGFFAGQVDEARIWSVARTQEQIQSSMNVEIVSPVAGLLGRWGMNEGSGPTAFNTAGSAGVNGTLVGGATWVAGSSGVNPAPNQPPVIDSVTIDQATPQTNDTLTTTVAATDPDGPAPTIAYQWTRNGTDISGATAATLNLATAGNGDKGELIRVRVTASDGQATSSPMTSSPVTVANTAPSATVALDSASPGTNATLTATATKADVDAADVVTLTYLWTVNGNTVQTTVTPNLTDALDLSVAGNGDAGDVIVVTVTPNDGTANGTGVSDTATVFTPANQPPVIDSVTIDQATPQTNDTLTTTVAATDPDGPAPTIAYQWTRNGTDISGATAATLNLATAGNGDKGELIRVRVTASDGQATSSPMTSSPVTVANTAPSATVALDSASPGTNATLTATATKADVDAADVVTLTYLWTVNGNTVQTTVTPNLTDALDLSVAGNGDAGDVIVVTVTPNDGTANGTGVSDTATVFTPANQPPVIDSVTIDQATPQTNDTLTTTVAATDPDGPAPTIAYQWTRNGTDISGATAATLNLATAGNGDKGELIRVRVTASDGQATSSPMTSSPVTVANTAPSATVALDSASPGTNATLTATATKADVDAADVVTLTYLWTVNGNTVQTTVTPNLTDALDLSVAGNGDAGDVIVVTVTPNDGTANGTGVSDTATVFTPANQPPVIDSVTIDQATPQTNDTLTTTVAATDPDGPAPTIAYQWTRNGTDISGATAATLNLATAGNGDKGELIRVRVTASDGQATSSPMTSSPVTVANTAPSATVALDSASPGTNATLTATATKADVDAADVVTLTYLWTVNGNTVQTTVTPNLTDALDLSVAGNGDAGDVIVVTVTPNDGTANGTGVSDTATVFTPANQPPVIDSVTIDQATPQTNDTLTTTVAATDPDGPAPTIAYQWTRNGTDISGATAATLNLATAGNGDKGELIRVRVTASDGQATSSPMTSSPVTVANTAPSATVALDSASPGTNATLTATATKADVDAADVVTLTYLWTVNGNTVQTTVTPNLTDALDLSVAGNGDAGDVIVVTVTPNDGTANGTGVSDTATVFTPANQPPVIDSVTIDQATPQTNDTLTTTVAATDPDGPAPTIAYQWTRNGTDISGATAATLNLATAGNGDKGELIRVRVTASDGQATSSPMTSSPVTVANTAPSATVALDSASPGTNATLTATATKADVDAADVVTLTYLWTVNGNTVQTTVTPNLTDALDLSVAGNGDAGDVIVVTVTPNDGTANGTGVSDTATVTGAAIPPIFSDDFDSGNFLNWTNNTRLTIDNAVGSPTVPSARAQVTNQSASAYRDLGQTYPQACLSVNVNLASGTGIDLFRLRTAANGAIIKVLVNATGNLQIRSDLASTSINSGVALGTGWHNVELCGSVGGATTWDLYRDGLQIVTDWTANTGTTPIGRIQIGDTVAKTFTVNFDHVVLDLVVGESQAPDTTAPTTPGQPSGTSPAVGTIQISWAASTDASPPITYRVYRDGNPTAIGQTTATSFNDPGLTPGSSHTYTVDAVDAVNPSLPSAMSPASASILVSSGTPPIFSDDFTSGSMTAWTASTRLTIDNVLGSPTAPSARAAVTSQSAFAYRDLGTTTMTPCMSVNVNRASGGAFDVFRLRTAANGAMVKVAVNAGGNLLIRSDFAATSFNSGVALGTGWHSIELCGTVGGATTWDLYRDGAQIVTDWTANTGTTPVGRIQIGDAAAATVTANFDHVVLDQSPGEPQAPDMTAPTTPGQPSGTSPAVGTIQISWAASTDASPPITYRVYRDGNPTAIGQTTATSFNDPGLTPGSSHTYTVDAVDAVNPSLPSAMSPASASILVSSGTPPIFSEDFSSGNFLNWTNNTRLTIDNTAGSPTAPSARAQVTSQSAFAYRDLGTTTTTPCMSVNVNRASGAFDLFRLRTAAGGPIIKAVVTAAGTLQLRSDFSGATFNSGVALGTGWHSIELCGTVGGATTWDLYRDGSQIVTDWTADTGTTPVGRIQIGETAAKTFTVNFDDVRLDQVVG